MFSIPQQLDLFAPAHGATLVCHRSVVLPPQSSASYHLVLSDVLAELEVVWHSFYNVLEGFSEDEEADDWRLPEVEMLHDVQDRVNTLRAHWPGLRP